MTLSVNNVYIIVMEQWTPEKIKDLRTRLDLTQAEFAERIGVTRVYVAYMEGGDRRPGKTMQLLLESIENDMGREREGR